MFDLHNAKRRAVQVNIPRAEVSAAAGPLCAGVFRGKQFIRQIGGQMKHSDLVRGGHVNLLLRHGDLLAMGTPDLFRIEAQESASRYVAGMPGFSVAFQPRAARWGRA